MIRQRCAIYTRKSTEEGLEQDFNSLDAQREACAAYILSQSDGIEVFLATMGWDKLSLPKAVQDCLSLFRAAI